MGKKRSASAAGWMSAQISNLLEDGIVARRNSNGDGPVSVEGCFPEAGAFIVKFEGDEPSYATVYVEYTDKDGNPL